MSKGWAPANASASGIVTIANSHGCLTAAATSTQTAPMAYSTHFAQAVTGVRTTAGDEHRRRCHGRRRGHQHPCLQERQPEGSQDEGPERRQRGRHCNEVREDHRTGHELTPSIGWDGQRRHAPGIGDVDAPDGPACRVESPKQWHRSTSKDSSSNKGKRPVGGLADDGGEAEPGGGGCGRGQAHVGGGSGARLGVACVAEGMEDHEPRERDAGRLSKATPARKPFDVSVARITARPAEFDDKDEGYDHGAGAGTVEEPAADGRRQQLDEAVDAEGVGGVREAGSGGFR